MIGLMSPYRDLELRHLAHKTTPQQHPLVDQTPMKTKTILKLAAATALCLGAFASHAQITNQLVVHLAFDGTDGSGNYTNTVANSIVATPVGAPTAGTGKIG